MAIDPDPEDNVEGDETETEAPPPNIEATPSTKNVVDPAPAAESGASLPPPLDSAATESEDPALSASDSALPPPLDSAATESEGPALSASESALPPPETQYSYDLEPDDVAAEVTQEVVQQAVQPEPSDSEEEEEDTCCFHRNTYIGICGEDCLEMHAQEPWPQDVKLFQPYEVEQILLPDNANCLAVQAYLKMCGLAFEVEPRHNAEYMSPSGRVPFIKCGAFVVSELDPIIGFISTKGISLSDKMDPSQKADMRAYMSLVNTVLANAELYVTWVDSATVREVTKPRNGSVYPWPLNHFINWQKSSQVKRKLSVLGWYQKSLDEVYREVENCCNALSERLEKKDYFFGSSPTELDCAVYGHLYSILTNDNTKAYHKLGNVIRNYSELLRLVRNVDSSCFGRSTRLSVDASVFDDPPPPPPQEAPPPRPEEEFPPPPPPPPPPLEEEEFPPPPPPPLEEEELPPPPPPLEEEEFPPSPPEADIELSPPLPPPPEDEPPPPPPEEVPEPSTQVEESDTPEAEKKMDEMD